MVYSEGLRNMRARDENSITRTLRNWINGEGHCVLDILQEPADLGTGAA